jgi:FMN phosphatase YigB (HAD superfamily)
MIKHVWFDFSETIARLRKDSHDRLRYSSYAFAIGKPVTEELRKKYEVLYEKNNHSNAAIFRSLGLPPSYWSDRINSLSPEELYVLAASNIPEVLKKLKTIVSISLFSNIQLDKVLPSLGIEIELFTHVLNANMIKEPKPALDGYYKIIELSALPPNEILYIGDNVGKDILPAKQLGILTGLMWSRSEKADYCFNGFDEILNLFN